MRPQYILDGLLMNPTGKQIKEQYADTGGFTDLVFAATSLLGYLLIPRIRDLPSKSRPVPGPITGARELQEMGREVRLMPPSYVKPYMPIRQRARPSKNARTGSARAGFQMYGTSIGTMTPDHGESAVLSSTGPTDGFVFQGLFASAPPSVAVFSN